jgi:hypothetical protein
MKNFLAIMRIFLGGSVFGVGHRRLDNVCEFKKKIKANLSTVVTTIVLL